MNENVSETNDADLNCYLHFHPVFGCPHYAGPLTGFLPLGRGEIDNLLTLGNCYIPRYVSRIRVSID